MISFGGLFARHVLREICILRGQLRFVINSSLFFLMIIIFFPLTMPADVTLLRTIAPGLVWIALLLSFLLSSERLFQQDYEDGVIEQWLISGFPVEIMVVAKLLVHWCIHLLPLLFFCPIMALIFNLDFYETSALMLGLMCGSPAILFLCALTSVFGSGLKQKGVFMALILLPLTIPLMIFGSGLEMVAMQGQDVSGYLALLLAMSLLAVALLPFAIVATMRICLAE